MSRSPSTSGTPTPTSRTSPRTASSPGFSDFIFHYDFFVLGGVGAISTRPIAVIDPDNRTFTFKPKLSFHVGGGLADLLQPLVCARRSRCRDYIFFDKLENSHGRRTRTGKPNAQDTSTWLAEGTSFTNNVQAQVGLLGLPAVLLGVPAAEVKALDAVRTRGRRAQS